MGNVPCQLGGTSLEPSLQLPPKLMMPAAGWSSAVQSWLPKEITLPRDVHEEVLAVPAGRGAYWQWCLHYSTVTFEVVSRSGDSGFTTVVPRTECNFHEVEDPVYGELPSL